jgi:glycosyltransferase involved in cell wall biosynthesis
MRIDWGAQMSDDDVLRVVIAIPTYRRNDLLGDLLAEAKAQIAALPEALGAQVSALVVDNDPDGGAADVARVHGIRYVHEPSPGIAAVRNRALRECADQDALIFIDDDELPAERWLEILVRRYRDSGADAVVGRVHTPFPEGIDPWIRASGAFIRPTRTDGQQLRECATNNLLLDLSSVAASGLRFDERFGLSGGSDSLFSRQFTARGYRIVWAQDALVIEREDAERLTREWVLRRTYRFGNTAARVNVALASGTAGRTVARLRIAARGVARVAGGTLRAVAGRLGNSLSHRARGERTAARGRGMLAGAFGKVYDEYGLRRAAAAS